MLRNTKIVNPCDKTKGFSLKKIFSAGHISKNNVIAVKSNPTETPIRWGEQKGCEFEPTELQTLAHGHDPAPRQLNTISAAKHRKELHPDPATFRRAKKHLKLGRERFTFTTRKKIDRR